MSTKYTKIFFVGLMAAVMMVSASSASAAALTQSQVDAIITMIQSFGADATTVANVRASLTGGTVTIPSTTGIVLSGSLKMGDNSESVKNLQIILNKDAATQVASTGAGSPGNESTYFGSLTKAAVIKFQNKYASEVLTPIGLTAGTGYVGAMTIAKLNAVAGGTTTTGGTTGGTTTVPAGTGLTISSATQPTATLAVQGAARVPFTKVTLTAGTDGDVVVTGINVERTGLAQDAVLAGIVLLDENGQQLGIAKTLGSNHQATVGEAFTVKSGQSRTMTIAGNMAASLALYAGQVAYISVTGANTTATVSGSLPITGAGHTINASLTIGSATSFIRGPLDPNGAQTKNIGTTGYTFSAVKFTAGSAEKIRVKSIRWNQSGSAASADLANVKTYVDGVAYDATVSSDGKYYSSIFGDGVVVDKGGSIEISIKGDVAGGSARTISFDLYKTTDLYITGETYGYGITPPTSGTTGLFGTTNPWYNGSDVTVSNGTITVSAATSVAAGNIAVSLSNQVLGGFDVEVKGEAISVASTIFYISTTSGSGAGLLTNVSLFNSSGAAVAGPVDAVASGILSSTVTFTDTITYPIGKNTYTLKGKVASTIGTNTTYQASTTPSTNWSTVTGQVTGNSITPSPSSAVSGNIMTVKAAAASVNVSGAPAAQQVVAGKTNFTFANIQIDVTASGEDIKFSTMPLFYTYDGVVDYLTGCQLYDGSTALNSGSNIPNLSGITAATTTFTLDTGLTVPKGTLKTVALKCNLSSSATSSSSYKWGADYSGFSATGLTSGQSATLTGTRSVGQLITVGTGTLVVAADSSAPAYTIVAAGTSGVTLNQLKFTATNEAITLNRVALQLTNTASSTAAELTSVYLYDGSVLIGTTYFTGSATTTTIIPTVTTVIPKDGNKVLTVKGDIAGIDINTATSIEGSLVAVDWDATAQAGSTYGTGESGVARTVSTGSDTTISGARVFKSYPVFAKTSVVVSTSLGVGNKTAQPLYEFSVTASPASGNGVGINQFTFSLATSTNSAVSGSTTVTNLKLVAYTDATFSTPVSSHTSNGQNGQLNATIASLAATTATTTAVTPAIVQIPAGSTYYFKLTGDITVAAGTGTFSGSISTRLLGDSAYPAGTNTLMQTIATVTAVANFNDAKLVWSPNGTTTGTVAQVDWTNGYGIATLPASGLSSTDISIK
ncbi:MAG: peptidoglycan-binding domain-containing protein [Candidatus Paceibacterota bacterium]